MDSKLDYFFNPKNIAVIGVSRQPKKFGRVVFENFLNSSFKGKVYPVNPNADTILGKKCYRDIHNIPAKIDMAVIAVPAAAVPLALKECADGDVKACVILSSGFSETGKKDEEKKLLEIAGGRMRIIGPNVVGIYDSYSGVDAIFNVRYRQARPEKGKISFISQSGAFGVAMMDWASSEGIGMSKFISIGNRADVDECDLIEYLEQDRNTDVIALYLEGAKRPKQLYETMKRVSRKKPIVFFKAGKSAAGTRAVSSHTGSMAGSAEIYTGMLKQARVIEAVNVEELFDFSKVMRQPLPKGDRVQIVTNGGGFGVVTTDEVVKNGLRMASISEETKNIIKKQVPAYASVSNPTDLTGDANSRMYRTALEAVIKDDNVDIIITILLLQISVLESNIINVVSSVQKKYNKPLLVCSTGGDFTAVHKKILESYGIPVYPSPHRAVRSAKILVDYSQDKV
jgi:acetyl coenzyme A synthetase (ADP forming)-like protein